MSPNRVTELQGLSVTCPLFAAGETPAGFTPISESSILERRDFSGAVADLLSWRLHSGSGLRVTASHVPLRHGTVVKLSLGPPLFSVTAPCRVFNVIDEPARAGFAYATLTGHPESGVERFLLSAREDGRIMLSIDGYSRPSTWGARFVPTVARWVQSRVTRRYLTALDAR